MVARDGGQGVRETLLLIKTKTMVRIRLRVPRRWMWRRSAAERGSVLLVDSSGLMGVLTVVQRLTFLSRFFIDDLFLSSRTSIIVLHYSTGTIVCIAFILYFFLTSCPFISSHIPSISVIKETIQPFQFIPCLCMYMMHTMCFITLFHCVPNLCNPSIRSYSIFVCYHLLIG